jgi:hypothetical protein
MVTASMILLPAYQSARPSPCFLKIGNSRAPITTSGTSFSSSYRSIPTITLILLG